MSIVLAHNQYGKSRVRLVKVEREEARHRLYDLNVDIQLAGSFQPAYTEGDNSMVLPTDTMKNTVYALARQPLGEIEEFGLRLADHFFTRNEQVATVEIRIAQNTWSQYHETAFAKAGEERRTTIIRLAESGVFVESGISDMVVLKTANSSFYGYIKDEFTTLKETRDRLFGTAVKASWIYRGTGHDYGWVWNRIRERTLEIFAEHESLGVQHTLYAIGEAVLHEIDVIEKIELIMPNRHCLLVDLSPFGLDNPNEVFLPIDEPHGLISAVISRQVG